MARTGPLTAEILLGMDLLRERHLGRLIGFALCVALCGAAVASARLTVGNGVGVSPGQSAAASSECPAGLEARKGGFSADFDAEGGAEVTGFRMRGRGWRVLATNTGEDEEGVTVESYCSPAASRRLVERAASVPVPPLTAAVAVAGCRRNETLLSVGFRNSIVAGGPHVVVDGMRRTGARGLKVSGANLSPAARGRLTAYAYCGFARRPLVRSQTVPVPPLGKERLVARCPDKVHGFGHRPAVFGGFQGGPSDPSGGAVASPAQIRNFGDRVVVTAVNRNPATSLPMTVYAYCR